jgi:heterodisulfide reductase subunit B
VETLLYYPGCSIKRDFSEVERSSRAVLEALGYRVVELRDWYCCGGFPGSTALDHVKYVSSLRTLSLAQSQARELGANTVLVLCPFCYNTLKQAEKLPAERPDVYKLVAEYLRDELTPYQSGLRVAHLVEVLASRLSDLSKLAGRGLRGVRVAAYYGCMLLRPRSVAVDNPEDPGVVESIVKALGAEPVKHPYRSYCCGSYHAVGEAEIVRRNTSRVAWSVTSSGADLVVTPCPLCLYNLKKYTDLRVVHLSELVAYALGAREALGPEALRVLSPLREEA